jgi:hypothetical protein
MDYNNFIQICTSRYLRIQYSTYYSGQNNETLCYYLFAYEGNHMYECDIQDPDSISDFETKYKATSNQPIVPVESETGIPKVKPRPVEGTMAVVSIYCNLGQSETLDPAGNPHYRVIFTSTGITEIRFKPNYGYYITGGYLKLRGELTTPFIKCQFIFAPDFPSAYGGNWCFINNLKLDNITKEFKADVPPKYVKYYSSAPIASELCLRITHDPNEHAEIEMRMDIYI